MKAKTTKTVAAPRAARAWGTALSDFVAHVAWSPDDEGFATATLDGNVTLIDAQTGSIHRDLGVHPGGAHAVAWSPAGGLVASGGSDGRLTVVDARSGARVFDGALRGWVEHIAWSRDGSCVAASAGKVVRFWSKAGATLGEVAAHDSTVTSLLWHAPTSRFVSTCYGGVSFLEPGRDAPVRHLPWKGSILTAAISPDGRWIATGNQDGSVHVWEIATGNDLEMSGYPTKVRELAWGAEGPLLATGGGPVVTIWSFAGKGPAGTRPLELTGHQANVRGIAFVNGGRMLLTAGEDGLFHGARQTRGWTSCFVDEADGPLLGLFRSPTGRRVVAPGEGGKLYAWTINP